MQLDGVEFTKFLEFVADYLDYCKGEKSLYSLLDKEYSVYNDWRQLISQEETEEGFSYLFDQKPSFHRISRDQLLMNKLVPKHSQHVNPAGLTSDQMARVRHSK